MSNRGLPLRRITGHCTVAADRVTAWYRLAPQGWSFRPDGARERLIVDIADAIAQLNKRSLHLRVTTRPYPVSQWAAAHDANAPAPLPDWPDHVIRDQMHLARRSMADKEVYLGVDLGASRRVLHALSGISGGAADREVAAMAKPIREVDELLRHPGFEGTPVSPRQLEWLLHRSCSLGLPAPLTLGAAEDEEWEREDLGEFTDRVTWTAVPYGRTIVVRGETNRAEARILGHSGHRIRRHRLGRQLTRYAVTRQGVNDGTKKAIEDSQDDEPDPTVPAEDGGRRSADAPPRAETFARAQVVWDVTSDGGVSRASRSPRARVEPRVLPSEGVLPVSPSERRDPGGSAPPRESSGDWRKTPLAAEPKNGRAVSTTSGLADTPRPPGSVLTGEVVTGAADRVRHPAVPRAHDGNAQLADDGIGYFVYDPRTGAMRHRRAGVDNRDEDAS